MSPFLFFFIVQSGWISRIGDAQVSGAGLYNQGSRWSFEEFLWDLMEIAWHIPSLAQFAFRSSVFR